MVWILALIVGCTPSTIENTGSPQELQAFDVDGDALYSDLLDAGYTSVPGRYLVVTESSNASDILRGSTDRLLQTAEWEGGFAVEGEIADIERLAHDSRIVSIEPDWIATTNGKPVAAACASSTSQTVPAGVTALGTSSFTGSGVKVAVIDTGIDFAHTDLSVVSGVGYVGNTTGSDDNGHGTHVAGTIAGRNNTRGVIGVAPDASLYAVKVLDRRGSGSYSAIASGIHWAVDNGMDVANLSLGGPSDSTTLSDAVTRAYDNGVVLVVAAGNEGLSATTSYPANYDGEVLTVSAVDMSNGSFPTWSNYGIPPVDVAAPGVKICSTTRGGGYGTMDGTSMATPHVAGAVAVYVQGHPGATFADVEAALEAGVSPLTDTSRHTEDLVKINGF